MKELSLLSKPENGTNGIVHALEKKDPCAGGHGTSSTVGRSRMTEFKTSLVYIPRSRPVEAPSEDSVKQASKQVSKQAVKCVCERKRYLSV